MSDCQEASPISAQSDCRETIQFHCATHCPQVERFRAEIVTTSFPAHAHEGYVIGVVHRGVQQFGHRGVTHYAKTGSIVLVNPEEIHTAKAADEGGVGYQTLHVPTSMLREIGGTEFRFRSPVVNRPALARRLMHALAQLDASLTPEFWFERLSAILVDTVQAQAELPEFSHAAYDERLQQLLEYVEVNITSPLSLKTLANRADMSPQHLIRCFKRALGVTPHDYVQARRTALAKRLLKSGSPTEVAALVGFTDQSHLTRWLKACYGTTPSVYRKLLQHGIPQIEGRPYRSMPIGSALRLRAGSLARKESLDRQRGHAQACSREEVCLAEPEQHHASVGQRLDARLKLPCYPKNRIDLASIGIDGSDAEPRYVSVSS